MMNNKSKKRKALINIVNLDSNGIQIIWLIKFKLLEKKGFDLWVNAGNFLRKISLKGEDVYKFTGRPATDYRRAAFVLPKIEELKILADKPAHVSYEGYLAPETYRVFKDASLGEVLNKIIRQRNKEIGEDIWFAVEKSGRNFFEILTMASLLEKEVRSSEDKAMVADILWRRYDKKWALQVDSSVHYAVNKIGTVFTTEKDRAADSLWNTYKYRGLPLGPISNPGLDSIKAALYPEKNNYWYFLTGKDGRVYYAKTLEEHNFNRARYLSF